MHLLFQIPSPWQLEIRNCKILKEAEEETRTLLNN
jgi:hypothetical protein